MEKRTQDKVAQPISRGRYYFAIAVFAVLAIYVTVAIATQTFGGFDIVFMAVLLIMSPRAYLEIKQYRKAR